MVLKHILKFPKVRLYEGSWAEYSNHPDLPVETGPRTQSKTLYPSRRFLWIRIFRDLFPAALHSTYLKERLYGPAPYRDGQCGRIAARGRIIRRFANICDWLETKDRVRGLIATMLGGPPVTSPLRVTPRMGFVRSQPEFVGTGDNIVSFANEFPANSYPWRKLREDLGSN